MFITFKDIIDILLVTTVFFAIYRILRHSGASNLFWGILAFILTWLLVNYVFHLELTSTLFDRFVSVGSIALIVIFQEEIRSFFYRIGSTFNIEHLKRIRQQEDAQKQVHSIVKACAHMSSSKTGALFVITNQQELKEYADTGEIIDAILSTRIIENIFFKNTPLHDGALIIKNGRVWAAACILPISKKIDLPKQYGLRHRAALGLTEKTDAIAIVVSEETGNISIAKGNIIHTITLDELEKQLNESFGIKMKKK